MPTPSFYGQLTASLENGGMENRKYDTRSRYQVFVLRCWREQRKEQTEVQKNKDLRFSLQAVDQPDRVGFADMEQMVDFLRRRTSDS